MKVASSSETTKAALEVSAVGTIKGPALPPISDNAKRIFFVRHGEVINPGGDRPVYYGCQDVSLSELGKLEAKAAAVYLSQFGLQNIASSPLSRAIFGAEEILSLQRSSVSPKQQKAVIIYDGFTELDRGSWCGKTKEEIGSDAMDAFDACDLSVTPDRGESYPALVDRVLAARDALLECTDTGKASALVSHLQVTRSILSDALGIPTNKMAGLKIATASVTCIDFDSSSSQQTVHFQSFKPDAGLQTARDGAN